MNFDLSDKQTALQQGARQFLEESYSTDQMREAEQSSEGFPIGVWEQGSKHGWPGVLVPEEFGGGGGGLLDACVLFEEIGRAGAALPLVASSGIAATILKASPQGEHRDRALAEVASGKIVAPALVDEQGRNEWDEVRLPLSGEGENLLLSGKKILVPFGSAADELLVSAVASSGETVLVVVDPAAEGVTIARHHARIGVPLSSVDFDQVRISGERVIHRGEDARAALHAGLQAGSLLATAEAVGLSDALTVMAAKYVTERKAFGQSIGTFQAVAHPVADMKGAADAIRILAQEAAWRVDTGRDADEEIASTKALANEFFERTGNDTFRFHGANGYSIDYDVQLFLRRIQAFCQTLGETQESLSRAATALGI